MQCAVGNTRQSIHLHTHARQQTNKQINKLEKQIMGYPLHNYTTITHGISDRFWILTLFAYLRHSPVPRVARVGVALTWVPNLIWSSTRMPIGLSTILSLLLCREQRARLKWEIVLSHTHTLACDGRHTARNTSHQQLMMMS